MQKLLIVDDEIEMLDLLAVRFVKAGFDVHKALNGKEALEILDEGLKPDLIILDEMMPEMDGYRFLKVIKKDKKYSDIPVIVLTARSAMKDTFLQMGIEVFMTKPFDDTELIDNVTAYCGSRVRRRSSARIILMAGEETDEFRRIRKKLKEQHFYVESVEGGFDLIERAVKQNPSLILIPYDLRGCSVKQVVRLLRGIKECRLASLVVYSWIDKRKKAPRLVAQLYAIEQAKKEFAGEDITEYLHEFTEKTVLETTKKYFAV